MGFNVYKMAAKESVVEHIVDEYVHIEKRLLKDKTIPPVEYSQKVAAMNYLKHLLKTITAENDEYIQEKIDEGYERLRKEEESDLYEEGNDD